MAPQATLTFHSLPVALLPDDPCNLGASSPVALWPSKLNPSGPTSTAEYGELAHIGPREPPVPVIDVTGLFSLEEGGAVRVGHVRVSIAHGTFVGLCRGLGEFGTASRGLWWNGVGFRGESGVWTLQLIRATERDATAIHRLLLYLPPIDIATSDRPTRLASLDVPPTGYRNSLILYDQDTRRVASIVPLASSRPIRGPLPPLPTSKPLPPTPGLSRGAEMARYVDRVAQGIHPDPTPESLSAAERLEQVRIERQASREEDDWDAFTLVQTLPGTPLRGISDRGPDATKEDKVQEPSLDNETAAPSLASVSSLATFGTDLGAAGHERGGDPSEADCSSPFASVIEDASHFTEPLAVENTCVPSEEGDSTPTPSQLDTQAAASSHSLDATADSIVSDTLTNGNAVLLSFLEAPSIVDSPSLSSRIAVTIHPLSNDQMSDRIDAGSIEPARVEIKQGQEARGFLDWLSSFIRGTAVAPSSEATSLTSWTEWWFGLWSSSTSDQTTSSSRTVVHNSRGKEVDDLSNSSPVLESSDGSLESTSSTTLAHPDGRRGTPGDSTEEAQTSRLSVIYVDEEGRSSRAFVERR